MLECRPYPLFGICLILAISAEIIVLGLQKKKGALYFVPMKFRPNRYNYIRKIPDVEDLDNTMVSYVY